MAVFFFLGRCPDRLEWAVLDDADGGAWAYARGVLLGVFGRPSSDHVPFWPGPGSSHSFERTMDRLGWTKCKAQHQSSHSFTSCNL